MEEYARFIEEKSQMGGDFGFTPASEPEYLFDFQVALVEWATRKGRAAIFADCGLGKTAMQLAWADHVCNHTGGKVLILTPLAVSHQTEREGEKFGVDAKVSREGVVHPRITITNYQRLHYFRPEDFAGVVCDESSILKSFDGATKAEVTAFMRKVRYRLLCTATAAPNDFTELGTSSEALGYLGHMDMLNRFFKNDGNNCATGRHHREVVKWRLKGHAETPFWRWVCSWARAIRSPADIGFDASGFALPPLTEDTHTVEARTLAEGTLFAFAAVGLHEQREERRRTIEERCERLAALVNDTGQPALVWCHLNDEGDLLEKLIPDCLQVSGADSDDTKEDRLLAFARGDARVLVTKPKIGAWGLNFQHCAHVALFPSHSYEQYYQGVRRCWRFGQKRPVTVDIVASEGEIEVMKNLHRKARQADEMFTRLVAEMNAALHIARGVTFTTKEEVPAWLF